MNTEAELVNDDDDVIGDAAHISRALALPGAREVMRADWYEKTLKALTECEVIIDARAFFNHAEAAAMLAKQLEDNELMTKARRITALTYRRLGEELEKIPKTTTVPPPKGAAPSAKIHIVQSRREVAQRAGISPGKERKATQIAKIPFPIFDAMVNQPGACSGADLLDVAADIGGGGAPGHNSHHHHVSQLKKSATTQMREFQQFLMKHEPRTIAKLYGGDTGSVAHSAIVVRDWLNGFIKALK